MRKHTHNLLIATVLLITVSIGCNLRSDIDRTENAVAIDEEKNAVEFKRIDSYEINGQRFAFYKIPNGLDRETLIETARAIHKGEDDARLILVDDDAHIDEYRLCEGFQRGKYEQGTAERLGGRAHRRQCPEIHQRQMGFMQGIRL